MVKIFQKMTKREWCMVLCSLVFIIAQVWLDLKMPEYMSTIARQQKTIWLLTGELYPRTTNKVSI